MWTIPAIVSRDDALALAVYELASDGGLEAVTMRAVARRARMAAGTITNNYATRDQLLATCASVLGRWMVWANTELLGTGDPARLLPPTDRADCYRRLLVVWRQLEACALTSPAVAEQVERANALDREMLAWHADGGRSPVLTRRWLTVRGVQAELLRPGSGLTRELAAELLGQA